MSDPTTQHALSVAQRLQALGEGCLPDAEARALAAEVDRLFAAHQRVVYSTCLRMIGDRERAAELAQDALLIAYRKLPTFRGEASLAAWLVSIARYRCLNARRKQRDLLTEDGVIDDASHATALSALRRNERDALLQRAAAACLDATEQEAVYLRYVEQVPLTRIEELLQLDAKSGARGLLQRCKRKLRRQLDHELKELGHGTSLVFGSVPT